MKLTVFLILFGVLRLSADTYAQTDSISLDLSNATCKEALDEILLPVMRFVTAGLYDCCLKSWRKVLCNRPRKPGYCIS